MKMPETGLATERRAGERLRKGFGAAYMAKFGYEHGQGLGKDGQGAAEALRVKKKKDNLGVGTGKSYDWGAKWWEGVFNGAAKAIKAKGGAGGASSDSDSSDSSDSDSSDSDSSDSDSEGGAAGVHADGTTATMSAEEAAINRALRKDKKPWIGRFGGREGKMARIRAMEEKAAAEAAAKSAAGGEKGLPGQEGAGGDERPPKRRKSASRVAPPSEREPASLGAEFPPLPADWWGHGTFVRAGDGLGAGPSAKRREGRGFTENDQEALFNSAHGNAAAGGGRHGLGRTGSDVPLKVAAGLRWTGTKMVFEAGSDEPAPKRAKRDKKEKKEKEKRRAKTGGEEDKDKESSEEARRAAKVAAKEERRAAKQARRAAKQERQAAKATAKAAKEAAKKAAKEAAKEAASGQSEKLKTKLSSKLDGAGVALRLLRAAPAKGLRPEALARKVLAAAVGKGKRKRYDAEAVGANLAKSLTKGAGGATLEGGRLRIAA